MKAGFWAYVTGAFGVFVSIGLALFLVDNSLPADWRRWVEPLRISMIALGLAGAVSTQAHSRGLAGVRHVVRASVVVGTAAFIAYTAAFFVLMLVSDDESFRGSKVLSIVFGGALCLVFVGLALVGARLVWARTGPAS